jgi:hypothetical protein
VEFLWDVFVQHHSRVAKIQLCILEDLFDFRHRLKFGWPIRWVRTKRRYGDPRLVQDCKLFTPPDNGAIVLQAAARLDLASAAAIFLELSDQDIFGFYFSCSPFELQLGVLQGLSTLSSISDAQETA